MLRFRHEVQHAEILRISSRVTLYSSARHGWLYFFCDNIEETSTRTMVTGPFHYTQPANAWIDNARMASYLRAIIEAHGRQQLPYSGYDCSLRPVADCPDCLLCTEKIRGVHNAQCKPEGDLFIRAYVGPGSNVQAQTYWRK